MHIAFFTILDSAFTAFLSFITSFLILNFYVERPYSIIFGACISIPIFLIALDKMKKSSAEKSLDKEKLKAVNGMCNSLCLLENYRKLELFERAINRRGLKTLKKKGGIFIEERLSAVFVIFSFDGITKTDVVRVFNSISSKDKAYIFGQSASKELLDFIDRFDGRIEFIDGEKTYDFLCENNCLPKEAPIKKSKPKVALSFFSKLFIRKNSKRFLTFGFLFLFMSAFVIIRFYYICCACLFFTLSLFCRLFGKEETKKG